MSRKSSKTKSQPPVSATRVSLTFWLILAVVVLLFLFVWTTRSVEPLGMDQGLFATFGQEVLDGELPYRDVWDSKPPAILYTYPLAYLLFGRTPDSIWLFEGIWLLATALAAFGLARRLWGSAEGLAAATLTLVGLWAPGFGGYWGRAQAEEFLALWLLLAAWMALKAEGRIVWALLAGFFCGLAGLYKVPAMALCAAWPIYWWASTRRGALVRTVLMGFGAAAVWVGAWLWFALHGASAEFVEAVFRYNTYYAGIIAQGKSLGGVLVSQCTTLATAIPTALIAGLAGFVLLGIDRRKDLYFVGPWFLLLFLAVTAQRQLAGYHFLLIVPALALSAGYGLTALLRRAKDRSTAMRRVAQLVVVVLGMTTIWEIGEWNAEYAKDAAHRFGRMERAEYLQSFGGGAFSPAGEEAAAEYIKAHSEPSDTVLVWGLSPGIYALSQRKPATRYPFHHLLLTNSPLSSAFPDLQQRRKAFMERLKAKSPAVILVGSGDRNGFEPEDSYTQMVRFPEFRAFLFGGYEEQEAIGRFRVFLAKNGIE